MKNKIILQGTCSEAVFRFHTAKPEEMQEILQAIKNEVISHYSSEDAWLNRDKIPLYDKPEMYDTEWNGELTYHGKTREKYDKQINDNWKARDEGKISKEEALEKYSEMQEKMRKEIYPKTMINACAGLGDNDSVITVEDKSFTLNIGNNDISEDKTGWTDVVDVLGMIVEEAETSDDLSAIARDCTCGIRFFGDSPNLRKDPNFTELFAKYNIDLDPQYYMLDEAGNKIERHHGNEKFLVNPNYEKAVKIQKQFRDWRKKRKLFGFQIESKHIGEFLMEIGEMEMPPPINEPRYKKLGKWR